MHIANTSNPGELHGPPEYTVDSDYLDEAPPPYSAAALNDGHVRNANSHVMGL